MAESKSVDSPDASQVSAIARAPAHEHADRRIAVLAGAQHGVVARRQLLQLGLTAAVIHRRITTGGLHAVHRGVYAVGHTALTLRSRWMAAVLACGAGATLSHRDAGALWGIRPSAVALIDISGAGRCRRPGIRCHQIDVPFDEREIRDGIPVTSVARTLFDLAAILRPRELARAAAEADALRLAGPLSLAQLLERHAGRAGAAQVRRLLAAVPAALTKSQLEEHFVAFVARHRLPPPLVNASLHVAGMAHEPDAMWPAHGLLVEVDSRTFHDTASAFESDRAKDRALMAAGWRVVRVTLRALTVDGARTAQELRLLLAAGRPIESFTA